MFYAFKPFEVKPVEYQACNTMDIALKYAENKGDDWDIVSAETFMAWMEKEISQEEK